jgi:hypothetical protein
MTLFTYKISKELEISVTTTTIVKMEKTKKVWLATSSVLASTWDAV